MTTIACDGKSMASDGLCTDQWNMICDTERCKVFKLSDGRIIGAAGNSFDANAWRKWVEGGKEGDCPIESDLFSGLILCPDGVILWVDHKGRELPTPAPCAIGSGQDVAIGCMMAGWLPEDAVRSAMKRDVFSGGRIFVEELDEQFLIKAA